MKAKIDKYYLVHKKDWLSKVKGKPLPKTEGLPIIHVEDLECYPHQKAWLLSDAKLSGRYKMNFRPMWDSGIKYSYKYNKTMKDSLISLDEELIYFRVGRRAPIIFKIIDIDKGVSPIKLFRYYKDRKSIVFRTWEYFLSFSWDSYYYGEWHDIHERL